MLLSPIPLNDEEKDGVVQPISIFIGAILRAGHAIAPVSPFTPRLGCRWLQNLEGVQKGLPGNTKLQLWNAGLFDTEIYGESFRQFQKVRRSPQPPLTAGLISREFPAGEQAGEGLGDDRFQAWRALLQEADSSLLSPQVTLLSCGCVVREDERLMITDSC